MNNNKKSYINNALYHDKNSASTKTDHISFTWSIIRGGYSYSSIISNTSNIALSQNSHGT